MSNSTFNGVMLGDHAWISVDTDNEVEIHKIPRADGAIIRRRGGGVKTITISGWIVKTTKTEIEQYFDSLAANLTSSIGTLIVNGISYTNCILQSVKPSTEHNRWATFTITFIKSG